MAHTTIDHSDVMTRRKGTTARASGAAKLPWQAQAFIVSLVLPVFVSLGGLRLTPLLVLQLAFIIPLTIRWMSNSAIKKNATDVLLILHCIWAVVALAKNHGIGQAIEPGAIVILQAWGSYLFGRVLIRNARQFLAIIKLHFWLIAALLPFGLFEFVTGRPLFIDLFGIVASTYANVNAPPRMGFERVQGAFEHPILNGVFNGSLFALLVYNPRFKPLDSVRTAIVTVATFISLSTGALLSLSVQTIIVVWGRVLRSNKAKWTVLIGIFAAAYVTIDLLSNRTPFDVFVSYLTFNTGSSYNRILIWQFGTAEVARHPIFGIGLNDWIRPWWMHSGSMDNFWLVQAVRYGLPGLIFLAGGFLILIWKLSQAKNLDAESAYIRTAFIICLVGIFFAISSVHLWNATYCWLLFLIGAISWVLDSKPEPHSISDEANAGDANAIAPQEPTNPWARQRG